jgi:hypothetical protein
VIINLVEVALQVKQVLQAVQVEVPLQEGPEEVVQVARVAQVAHLVVQEAAHPVMPRELKRLDGQ